MPLVTKLPPPPSTTNNVENQSSSNNEFPQKLYNLSSEECNKVITTFKEFTKTTTMHGKIESSTIPADSSIWLLEAALNFDFDKKPMSSVISRHLCDYEIDINNNSVSTSQFVTAYNYFTNQISQKISLQKQVKVIDITSKLNGNKLKYIARIIFFTNELVQKTLSPCDPYTSGSAGWSVPLWISTNCGSAPSNDAPTWAEAKLNCTSYDPGCSGSWYWTSITTTNLNNLNGTYSPNLFYVGSSTTPCDIFSYTTINNYVTNCKNYGTTYHPGGSYILIDYNIIPSAVWLSGFSWKIYWSLDIRYGIPQCNQGGGGNRIKN